jgi:hypothetical protein
VHCDTCGAAFKLDEASLPPSHGMGASGQGVPAATARAHGARKPLAKRKPHATRKAKAASQAPLAAAPQPQPQPKGRGTGWRKGRMANAAAGREPEPETMLAALQRVARKARQEGGGHD